MMGLEAVGLKCRPVEAVILRLEELLDKAKSGELQGFAVAGINERGEVIIAFAGERRVFSQVGALESLKLFLLIEEDEWVRTGIERISLWGP